MKKLLSVLMAIFCLSAALMALPVGAAEMDSFTDIDDTAWYYPGVDYVVSNSVMVGMSDTAFGPSANLTRAMFVATLSRLSEQEPKEETELPFTDVSADEWYYDHIRWAYENKVVSGLSDNTFAPNENITREQMCRIMVNFANHMGYEFPNTDTMNILDSIVLFSDDETISTWAYDAVYTCAAAGVVSGMGNGAFEPQGLTNRAQVASMLRRFVRSTTTEIGEGVEDAENKTITYKYSDKFAEYATRVDTLAEDGKVAKSVYTDDLSFTSTTEYTYDEKGLLASEKYADSNKEAYTITYTYDAEDELESFLLTTELADGKYEITYDAQGTLISVKVTNEVYTVYTEYFADGSVKLEKMTMADGSMDTTVEFDENGNPVKMELTATAEGKTVEMAMEYDKDGNPNKITIKYDGKTLEATLTEEKETIKITLADDSWYSYETATNSETVAYTDSEGASKTMTQEEAMADVMEKLGIDMDDILPVAA